MKRVIIVDDEKEICELLKNFLVLYDLEVDVAEDGYSAFELLNYYLAKEEYYSHAFIDLNMPLNGYEVIKAFQEKSVETKLTLITAYHLSKYVEKVKQKGVEKILIKPFELKDVYHCIFPNT